MIMSQLITLIVNYKSQVTRIEKKKKRKKKKALKHYKLQESNKKKKKSIKPFHSSLTPTSQ
jgi:hypothetical protein